MIFNGEEGGGGGSLFSTFQCPEWNWQMTLCHSAHSPASGSARVRETTLEAWTKIYIWATRWTHCKNLRGQKGNIRLFHGFSFMAPTLIAIYWLAMKCVDSPINGFHRTIVFHAITLFNFNGRPYFSFWSAAKGIHKKNYALYWKFCFEIFTVCLTHFPPKMFIQMHPFREFPLKDKEVVFSAFYIFISKSVGCEIPM